MAFKSLPGIDTAERCGPPPPSPASPGGQVTGKLGSRGHFWTAWELGSPSLTPKPLCPRTPTSSASCPARSCPRLVPTKTHRCPLPPPPPRAGPSPGWQPGMAGQDGDDDPKAPTSPGWGSSPASHVLLHFHQLAGACSPLRGLRVPAGSDPSLPPALPKGAGEGEVIPRLRYYSRE